jgi:hypothetical protein
MRAGFARREKRISSVTCWSKVPLKMYTSLCRDFPENPCREIVAGRIHFAVKRQSQAYNAIEPFHCENAPATARAGARREGRTRNSCAPLRAEAGAGQNGTGIISKLNCSIEPFRFETVA